jgi:simple sugar transport system ATP-binding protein
VAAGALVDFDVRPPDLDAPAGKLSGGNQQKLIAAREFHMRPRVLIAAQPTRGVDVGAIEFIHGRIVRARDEGAGVLLVSSELDEILALSDRILVMYEGRMVAEFARGRVTESELGLKMGGG